jgi:Planctomycete cytochrome C
MPQPEGEAVAWFHHRQGTLPVDARQIRYGPFGRQVSLSRRIRSRSVFYLTVFTAFGGLGCGGATDDRPVEWSFIAATIVEPSCATVNCHSAITKQGGVDLHSREVGYYALVNGIYVFPGQPDASSMVALMNAQGSLRMPPDVPLPQADIELIEKWIAAGALNN